MLLKFRVSNFRSIRDEVEIDLYRGRGFVEDDRWRRPDVGTVAAIYGPNASGKSTVLRALHFVSTAVRDSFKKWTEGETPRVPFLLDDVSAALPSEFEVDFLADDGHEYIYGFAIDDNRVVSEHLYQYKSRKRTVLYERDDEISFGPSFRGPARHAAQLTSDSTLFLSVAAASGIEVVSAAHRWLSDSIRLYDSRGYSREHGQIIKQARRRGPFVEAMSAAAASADLGATSLKLEENPYANDAREQYEKIMGALQVALPDNVNLDLTSPDFPEHRLVLQHAAANGSVPLPFEAESDGTHAFLSFVSVALRALEKGSTCIVDEIDSSLHPVLVSSLVQMFQDPTMNRNQAQLLFTTHDASLLSGTHGERLLSKDSVWFVEKSAVGETQLFALDEYKRVDEQNWQRAYLSGRYGAMPSVMLRNAIQTFWDARDRDEQ
ncbi:AAA family ATPase [Microbacterium foliorum]|uniref:AAA family ATPase n=1 Tax=Microbacterium foliorum TaxID=104336 RepID=UPI00188636B1|nr:ATP-binding protein [Microbacterium foliorum]